MISKIKIKQTSMVFAFFVRRLKIFVISIHKFYNYFKEAIFYLHIIVKEIDL